MSADPSLLMLGTPGAASSAGLFGWLDNRTQRTMIFGRLARRCSYPPGLPRSSTAGRATIVGGHNHEHRTNRTEIIRADAGLVAMGHRPLDASSAHPPSHHAAPARPRAHVGLTASGPQAALQAIVATICRWSRGCETLSRGCRAPTGKLTSGNADRKFGGLIPAKAGEGTEEHGP